MLLTGIMLQLMKENLSSTSKDRNKECRLQWWWLHVAPTDCEFCWLPASPHVCMRLPDREVTGKILLEVRRQIFPIKCISIFNKIVDSHHPNEIFNSQKSLGAKKRCKKIVIYKLLLNIRRKSTEMRNTFLNYVTNSSKFTHLNYGI